MGIIYNRCHSKIRTKGFSLIELLIAIFIFFLIFSGVMKSLAGIFTVQKDSRELAIASQILGDIAEKIKTLREALK